MAKRPSTPEQTEEAALFSTTIDGMVRTMGMDYMQAIVHYCEECGVEIETVAPLVKAIR